MSTIPNWMLAVYVWVLRDGRKLEDLWISRTSDGEILIAPKETTPLEYMKVGNMKQFIESGVYNV